MAIQLQTHADYDETIRELVRRVSTDADSAFIATTSGSPAEKVRRAVEAAIRCAVANRLMAVMAPDGWPPQTVHRPYGEFKS